MKYLLLLLAVTVLAPSLSQANENYYDDSYHNEFSHNKSSYNNRRNASCIITSSPGSPYPIAQLVESRAMSLIFEADPYRTSAGKGIATFIAREYHNLPCQFKKPLRCQVVSEDNGSNTFIYLNGVRAEFFNTESGSKETNWSKVRRTMKSLYDLGVCD